MNSKAIFLRGGFLHFCNSKEGDTRFFIELMGEKLQQGRSSAIYCWASFTHTETPAFLGGNKYIIEPSATILEKYQLSDTKLDPP
jgi:hypothetical protein